MNIESFKELGEQLGVNLSDYDLVLVTDGSGTTLWKPCGWAVAVYQPDANVGLWFTGGASDGTNSYAELEPFLYGLWRAGREWSLLPADCVLCVTDSQYTAYCGTGEYDKTKFAPMWAQLDWYEKQGIKFDWRWVPRNSNPVNEWADKAAGKTRLALVGLVEELSGSTKVSA